MNNKTAVPLLRLWKFGRNRGQDAERYNKTPAICLITQDAASKDLGQQRAGNCGWRTHMCEKYILVI